jgi:hypothetical protein
MFSYHNLGHLRHLEGRCICTKMKFDFNLHWNLRLLEPSVGANPSTNQNESSGKSCDRQRAPPALSGCPSRNQVSAGLPTLNFSASLEWGPEKSIQISPTRAANVLNFFFPISSNTIPPSAGRQVHILASSHELATVLLFYVVSKQISPSHRKSARIGRIIHLPHSTDDNQRLFFLKLESTMKKSTRRRSPRGGCYLPVKLSDCYRALLCFHARCAPWLWGKICRIERSRYILHELQANSTPSTDPVLHYYASVRVRDRDLRDILRDGLVLDSFLPCFYTLIHTALSLLLYKVKG